MKGCFALALALVLVSSTGWAPVAAVAVNADLCTQLKSQAAQALTGPSTGFISRFWNENSIQLPLHTSTNDATHVAYWVYAQGAHMMISAVQEGLLEYSYVSRIYLGQVGASTIYYDDRTWMALMLLDGYDLAKPRDFLLADLLIAKVNSLYSQIVLGWDTTCCVKHRGGIWWRNMQAKQSDIKATASNFGPAILGAKLGLIGNRNALAFAEKVYAFWRTTMVDDSTGMVYDNFNQLGEIGPSDFTYTYNNGLMIGAAAALYQATGRESYLEDAALALHFILEKMTVNGPKGLVLAEQGELTDATECTAGDSCTLFKGATVRFIADFVQAAAKVPAFAQEVQEARNLLLSSAQAISSEAMNRATKNIAARWIGPAPTAKEAVYEASQASAINAIIQALRLCPAG